MMKTIITLTVTAVLFAITTNVAEARENNPSPIKKPYIVKQDWDQYHKDAAEKKRHKDCQATYHNCKKRVNWFKKNKGQKGRPILSQNEINRRYRGCYDRYYDCAYP